MIDIYQRRIAEHQEKIDQSLNQINKLFKSMPQKIRDLPDVKKFQEIMDDAQKESNTQKADEKFDSALICLANTRNRLNIQLKKMEGLSTELRYSHINTEAKITRL